MHGPLTDVEAGMPILAALESYCGKVVDLDDRCAVGADELRDGASTVAEWLAGQGSQPGDRVVLAVGNGPAFVATFCGVLSAGGNPILMHGETPPEELRRFASQYAARYIVVQPVKGVHAAARPIGPRKLQSASWLSLSSEEVPLGTNAASFPQLISTPLHPTSGTTGQVKVAVRTACQAIAEATHYIDTMQVASCDRILCAVPMSHAYGFGVGFMISLVSGATLLTMRQFNPRAISRAFAEQQVTIFPAVPAMLGLVAQTLSHDARIPRLVLTAGAPMTEAAAAAFRQQTGSRVTPLYGTTETGGITVAVGEVCVPPTGCVGHPMDGVEVRVAAIDESNHWAPGVGRVCIRSSSMMSGYLTPHRIDASMVHDGWFETGDLGRLDNEGRIHLIGREKEIINVFGMKVVPSEVEEVIGTLPGVREVKAYAGTHRNGSDILQVAVAANRTVDVGAVRSHCEAHLAPYKRPQVIHFVDALPRSPLGKILRDKLP